VSTPFSSPSNCVAQDMLNLRSLIETSEEWLMNRVLDYAEQRNYIKYTSSLVDAWRVSIAGLSSALIQVMDAGVVCPEFGPDEDFTKDPTASFAGHHDRHVSRPYEVLPPKLSGPSHAV
jgi:hypothetical protein